MNDTIFNINDYKNDSSNIDLDGLDDRYLNTTGDTAYNLNIKSIQLYETGTIAFIDTTIQNTAFNSDVLTTIYDTIDTKIINSNQNNILSSNNIFTSINNFNNFTNFYKTINIFTSEPGATAQSLSIGQIGNITDITNNNLNSGVIRFKLGTATSFQASKTGINMMDKTITNISSLLFTDTTIQTTAFKQQMITDLQSQITINNNNSINSINDINSLSTIGKSQIGTYTNTTYITATNIYNTIDINDFTGTQYHVEKVGGFNSNNNEYFKYEVNYTEPIIFDYTGMRFKQSGVYNIKFAWSHSLATYGLQNCFVRTTKSPAHSTNLMTPPFSYIYNQNFTGNQSSLTNSFVSLNPNNALRIQSYPNEQYRYEYQTKSELGFGQLSNRWFLEFTCFMPADRTLYFQLQSNQIFSVENLMFIITRLE